MAIFGLSSTADYESYRRKNIRRSVQYDYPRGKAPLMGLLSLMDEEYTNDPEFGHWEYRYAPPKTLTASQGTSKGPIKSAADADAGDPVTLVADTEYIFCIDDATVFREGKVVELALLNTSAVVQRVIGIVTAITDRSGTPNKIKVRVLAGHADLTNGVTDENVDKTVRAIGSSFAQGRSNVSGEYVKVPSKFTNYTQIFRTPFSLPRTAIKAPLEYDKSGPYKHKAKIAALDHMVDLEMAALFGTKDTYTKAIASGDEAVSSTGEGLIQTLSGGILYHLERWEAGDYGTVTASADSDDDKRIVENASGNLTEETYDTYIERLFRKTNNVSNEKLCLCGNGAMLVLNQMWKHKTTLNSALPMTDTYGMDVTSSRTPFGTIHYLTHPLFNEDSEWRNNMLFLDVRNIKYRPLLDSDTKLLKNRQANDADHRKDEYLTEAGFEVWFPESHMLLKNVQSYTP